MESSKEFVRKIVGSLIELIAVRSLLGELKESDRVESCKEFVRRIVRCLTEWRAVRSLLLQLQGV